MRAFFLTVSANGCSWTAAYLTYTKTNNFFTDFSRFSCGNYHSGIRNGDTNTRCNFTKHFITERIIKFRRVYIISLFNTGNTDCMRTYSVNSFKMLCMHKKSCKFITIFIKPEKHTDTDIINTALHRSVHGLGMIIIIVLRPRWMKLFIIFLMIGFLKKNICAYTGILKLFIIFNGCCRYIYINAADCAVFMLYWINCFNAIKYIFNRIVYRVLPCFNCKALMPHILKGNNLLCNLLLS